MYLTMFLVDVSCPMRQPVAGDELTMCLVDVSCPMRHLLAVDVFDDVPGRCELSDVSAGRW